MDNVTARTGQVMVRQCYIGESKPLIIVMRYKDEGRQCNGEGKKGNGDKLLTMARANNVMVRYG